MLTYRSSDSRATIVPESYASTTEIMPGSFESCPYLDTINWFYVKFQQKFLLGSLGCSLSNIKEKRHLETLVNEFKELELNWDGYGGIPISPLVIDNSLSLIQIIKLFAEYPTPVISPKSHGTVSMVWEVAYGEGYIEIGNTRYSGYLQIGNSKPVYFEGAANSINYDLIAFIYCNLFFSKMDSKPITDITFKEFF